MFFKSDVKLGAVLEPQTVLGILVAKDVFDEAGQKFTITSISEGVHRKDSLHYLGLAFDIRIYDLRRCSVDDMVQKLCARLPSEFQIIPEVDHIHVEFDPNG